ncbi:transcriptional regulator, LacI family [Thermoactinomyces sp. DSM 45891]|uniref:catabolite control protein A n=1 Tax=Thermoactinomyces sp. DSM 45891 TaxID=1761907 RepID=UPI000921505B|nr:catabolite control protein A [Thermoactinomyces sp. DSM 45891]SFX44470.1 transcriptional regulator, LacI family [Thermoactinomyces sp. DSM 45891]
MKKKETITIYDVAREANVSMATVSRVVNGNPNVKPVTRKKVLEVIRNLGYRPNAVARGLASKKTTTVGVVIPDISNAFYAEVARGIEDIATMYNYNIILSNSDLRQERELRLIETLMEKQVDGLLFLGGTITPAHKEIFSASSIPIVLVATEDLERKLPFVHIDQKEASKEAVMVLLAEGHKKVGYISNPNEDRVQGVPRLEGYKQALHETGMEYDDSMVRYGDNGYRSGYQAMQDLLKAEPEITAVACASDEMAVGALHALQDAGKKVPEAFSVIGFHNIPLASQVRPLLSTVSYPMYDVGAVSMRLLTKYMLHEEIEAEQVWLPFSLELRNSTNLKQWPE